MPYTVDDFKLDLVIDKVTHFEHENPPEPGDEVPEKYVVSVVYHINDKPIDAIGSFITIRDLHTYGIKECVELYKDKNYGFLPLFTCTCGIAGCAGMFNSINIKERRHTIEWRVPNRENEYPFLDSAFYQFATPLYKEEIRKVCAQFVKFLVEHPTALYMQL